MWKFIHPNSLALISAALVATAIWVGFFANGSSEKIIASALAVIAGVFFTAAAKLHSETRDRAFAMITESSENKSLFKSLRLIRNAYIFSEEAKVLPDHLIRATYLDQLLDQKVNDVINRLNCTPSEFNNAIFEAANFFENMHIAIKHNEINEKIIYDFYSGMFCRFVVFIEGYLPILRNIPIQENHSHGNFMLPELFTGIELLYQRWIEKYCREHEQYVLCTKENKACGWIGTQYCTCFKSPIRRT